MACFVATSILWAMAAVAEVATAESEPATALLNRYAALSEQPEQSSLRQGLYLKSVENSCDALILHLKVKYCRATARDERSVLSVAIGKKINQPLREAHRAAFPESGGRRASTPASIC
jgi:hypothetical protein